MCPLGGQHLELDRLLLPADLAPGGEQLLVADERGENRRHDVLRPERLGDVAEDAGADRALDVRPVGVRGQHDHRERPLRVDAPRRLDTVETRHLQIENRDVRLGGAGELDRLEPVARLGADDEALGLEDLLEVETNDRLVLGDQDVDAVVEHDTLPSDALSFEVMANIRIPPVLRPEAAGNRTVAVAATTVRGALDDARHGVPLAEGAGARRR